MFQEKVTQEQDSGLLQLFEPEAAEELWEQGGWELEGTRHQWEQERQSSAEKVWRQPNRSPARCRPWA